MSDVWRIRMKSGASGVYHEAARAFAVSNGIVGAGWGLNGSNQENHVPDGCNDVQRYLRHAKMVFPSDRALDKVAEIFGNRMRIGDFCWMYIAGIGEYWCCRVDGEFEYRMGGAFDLHDLHVTRRCSWGRAGAEDAVPEVIRKAFAGPFGTVTVLRTNSGIAIKAAERVLQSQTSAVISIRAALLPGSVPQVR